MDEKEREELEDQLTELIAETAESVEGVCGMSGTLTETIVDTIPGLGGKLRGVHLDDRGDSLSADIYVIAEYGKSIPELAWNVQTAVSARVQEEMSIKLKKINIHVQGVSRPDRVENEEEEEQE